MAKILILRGLPASGKTTYAKKLVSQGNWARVNKDTLRTLLHFGKYTPKNETVVFHAEKALAEFLLKQGLCVVVDDTNLNPKTFQSWVIFAETFNVKYDVKRFHTSMPECIVRDAERAKKGEPAVGKDVIISMALQYNMYPKPSKGVVLCDIDGTIANLSHRLHFVRNFDNKDDFKKDWKSFFTSLKDDSLRKSTLELLKGFHKDGYEIFFITARPDEYRKETQKWLDDNLENLPYVSLFMRRSGDHRDDVDVKKDMYNKYFKNMNVHAVIDDRPKVIRMWQSLGLNVIDVGEGVEF